MIVDWIMGGDETQLPPMILSPQGELSFNDHAVTLGNALFTQIRIQAFQTYTLWEQNSMHPVLGKFLNKYIYNSELQDEQPGAVVPAMKLKFNA